MYPYHAFRVLAFGVIAASLYFYHLSIARCILRVALCWPALAAAAVVVAGGGSDGEGSSNGHGVTPHARNHG